MIPSPSAGPINTLQEETKDGHFNANPSGGVSNRNVLAHKLHGVKLW